MKIVPLLCDSPPEPEVVEKYRVQLLNAGCLAGREHVEFAVEQARRAFERGENISDDFLIEVLVRASATRQISVAIERLGIGDTREVVAVAEEVPEELLERYSCRACEEVLEVTPEKYRRLQEVYGITEEEVSTLAGEDFRSRVRVLRLLIRERIALLNAQ